MRFFKKIFGSNEREVAKLRPLLEKINNWENKIHPLSDEELKNKTEEFKKRIKNGETLDNILPEAFAVAREAAWRVIGERHYDEQILGGIVLHQGKIAEMKTGEGKTLTSILPIYLNALEGKGAHIVTVNDYLAKRDCNWMGAVFHFLGLETACVLSEGAYRYTPKTIDENEVSIEKENLVTVSKKEAYACDITYGTNNEFGFDYLRDNMARSKEELTQRELNFVIVDEVDSILIDEARTPLIISAPDVESADLYRQFAKVVSQLKEKEDYEIEEKTRTVFLTQLGISRVEKILGVENIYAPERINYVHHLEQALKAKTLFKKERDYIVKDGQVIIVDDFTGRLMHGRRFSEGLHQAIEAKEGVTVQRESRTLATITFQNYFRMYRKLAGMTGTAITSAEEFFKVYKLEVLEIPTHKKMIREDLPDVVYKNEAGKFKAIVEKIKEIHKTGQPILIGTIAIEKSEQLSALLKREGIAHEVLNAKNHEREALIIANAGQKNAVTIATNMAGRGTDIKLGEGVAKLGGLYVIGTERHEARRIDNQLRGRSGRQGDPGKSQFYVSLEDELMRRFGGDRLKNMMTSLGLPEDQPIQNKIISKTIESAQTKIEGFNFDIRKHILEYDDVMNKQREIIYKKRREILESSDWRRKILENIQEEIEKIVSFHYLNENEEKENKLKKIREDVGRIFVLPENNLSKLRLIDEDESLAREEKIALVAENLFAFAKEAYGKKEKELGEANMRVAEKATSLYIIDNHWMNHLDEVDHLRQGIGLRGYGQRDPLVEYKKEAYDLFLRLMENIRFDVSRTIFKISPVFAAPTEEVVSRKNWQLKGAEEQPTQFAAGSPSGEKTTKPKPLIKKKEVGRNDPCPCGSGKKYKKCCGR